MLDSEDIKKLTEYQLEVFKDVFMTKDDGKELGTRIDRVQNTLDAVLKDKQITEQEVKVLNHRMKKAEDWIDEASPKLGLKYEHSNVTACNGRFLHKKSRRLSASGAVHVPVWATYGV